MRYEDCSYASTFTHRIVWMSKEWWLGIYISFDCDNTCIHSSYRSPCGATCFKAMTLRNIPTVCVHVSSVNSLKFSSWRSWDNGTAWNGADDLLVMVVFIQLAQSQPVKAIGLRAVLENSCRSAYRSMEGYTALVDVLVVHKYLHSTMWTLKPAPLSALPLKDFSSGLLWCLVWM